jgi:cytochrome c
MAGFPVAPAARPPVTDATDDPHGAHGNRQGRTGRAARRRMVLGSVLTIGVSTQAAGGEAGRIAFETHCASCHAVAATAPQGPGPQLAGLAGRRIGGDAGFDYSPALQAAEGRWDAARLERFLRDPEEMFPGLWMGGNGVSDAAARQRIVEYLMHR